MLPLGIAVFRHRRRRALSVGLACIIAPAVGILEATDLLHAHLTFEPAWLGAACR